MSRAETCVSPLSLNGFIVKLLWLINVRIWFGNLPLQSRFFDPLKGYVRHRRLLLSLLPVGLSLVDSGIRNSFREVLCILAHL